KKFMEKYRYKSSPYADIGTFVELIKKNTPDDLLYLVDDTFSKITLYENKAKSASAILNDDGSYDVTFTVEAKKVYSDSTGIQTNAELNDWLEIGILGEEKVSGEKIEVPILLEKVFITDSLTTFSYTVRQKPVKAGIDPMNKFIDRVIDDNIIRVEL
ncbi:MAG: hypothetical protein ACJZ19_00005, partial [Candidatus Neomarinimicrobiota bacterium]